jgi:hypothetical protein
MAQKKTSNSSNYSDIFSLTGKKKQKKRVFKKKNRKQQKKINKKNKLSSK